mmetsp:Transcript_22148/g.33477  ORF Transcript_22148/g.33477 Transcript_22148/m.33477 type:complete len:442 (+) Transcript_22148:99-1424(+)|eukprot:CAMPEP_0178924932 /NCGR_PEP_ID=MMETSP0786-20121207/17607_1 /TAXON_ID=186022 /ORGANISM="Thalassionema frauenfeldii, Strain CCMP 1798" /LENGTH=441 /DNA_ID=CAMNT_0020599709 /DNA_START=31 /DNA_END=1356 /DNA_ORIENTATION=-
MGKRSNEHGQLRKEEYEAVLGKEASRGGKSFSKASITELKKRRIVKASRTPSRTPPQTEAVNRKDSETPNNPFASVSFGKSGNGTPSFSFSSSSNSSKPSDGPAPFSFSSNGNSSKPSGNPAPFSMSSNSNISKPSGGAAPFKFGQGNTASNSDTPVQQANSSNTETVKEKRLRKLNSDFRAKRKEQREKTHNLDRDVDLYLRYYRLICLKSNFTTNTETSATKAPVAKQSGNASLFSADQKSGNLTFDPKSNNDSKTGTISSAIGGGSQTSFSFGSSTASGETNKEDIKQAAAKASASFGTNALTTSSDAQAPAEESSNKSTSDEVSDPDWDTAYKVDKVKFYVYADDEWKSHQNGPLRLQCKKSDSSKKRMVIRDGVIGKVILNVMITNVAFKGREKQKKRYINFMALRKKEGDMEQMMIQCVPAEYSALLKKLKEMAG